MENKRQQFGLQKYTHRLKYGASFFWAFTATMLVASSVAQASDMQIYAVPTAGKKTIVMMLDTSGSMGPVKASDGYSYSDDYALTDCGTSSQTAVATLVTTLLGYSNKTAYRISSGTTPAYDRNFCYVTAGSANTTIKKPENQGGCEALPLGATGTSITGYRCFDRLTRLKDGMFAFLNSSADKLAEARVGLGHFSGYNTGTVTGDGSTGEILVAAKALGAIGSSHRTALKTAVAGLVAHNGTPTANAYAEAAAYLMGTTTYSETYSYRNIAVENQRLTRSYSTERTGFLNYRYKYTYNYTLNSSCTSLNATNFSNSTQTCATWSNNQNSSYTDPTFGATSNNSPTWTNQPLVAPYDSTNPTSFSNNPGNGTNQTIILRIADSQLYQINPIPESGMPKSKSRDTTTNPDIVMDRTASDLNALYKSPLPAAADRVSCDGQGVYILSDGAPTANVETSLMKKSLNDSSAAAFSCSGGLSGGSDWDCMGEFAKKLFNGGVIQTNPVNATNPVNVPIQTAFVGFGAALNNLSTTNPINACKLSSRTQSDRRGDDKCSPNQATNAVASPGYGNGGFFPTQTAQGITDSIIAFLDNIGQAPLAPLTTGAISVPADALSPSGLQPYGYLRALEPNPQSSNLIWAGSLKRYKVLTTGDNAGAFAGADGITLVYNADGSFKAITKDLWNSNSVYNNKSYNDGGIIGLGGAYSRVPMPISGQTENLAVTPIQYEYAANSNRLRKLFTDVAATGGSALTGASNGASLLRIPEWPATAPSNVATYVLGKFSTQTTLQDMPLLVKQKLLNYLGYSVPLDPTATALPTTLPISATPHLAMGGSIHSFPVQMTYSGTLNASGNLTDTRSQSILYGTMDGGLHIVDSDTGVEQMVFVPSELLRDSVKSKAIVKGESGLSLSAGLDGAWVADSLYAAQKAPESGGGNLVKASRMNIYGGLRMGGESYYGLNVLDPTAPKFLFRVGQDQANFNRMGQSWSKPVLANIRYGNAIKRVMIVGGGYDQCYENPNFRLSGTVSNTDFPDMTCNNKSAAQGNAVYIVDAETGERLWWTSNSGSNTNNTNMTHSVVSRISAIDRNSDGLVDHLYFGDLGGQVFRADLNNTVGTTKENFGKRVVRLANLATTAAGVAITDGTHPRFYEAPTVTIHDQGATTFMLIGIASGNRSTPLDVFPLVGRDGMLPSNAVSNRPVNNVYGVIDRDFIKRDLITGAPILSTQDIDLTTLKKDPQTLSGNIPSLFIGTSTTIKNGWYRSLSSNSAGTELADGSFRIKGGMKALEEPIAVTGNLIVPVYDPQGTGIAPKNPCLPRVVGETDRQRYCLPFGVCLNSDGTKHITNEEKTGFETTKFCPNGLAPPCNTNVLGEGIVGITPAPIEDSTNGSCPDFTIVGNEKGIGKWQCIPTINPTRWYERWKK